MNLPNWGMTQNGELYELQTSAQLINEHAGFVSHFSPTNKPTNGVLFPTPNASLFNDGESSDSWNHRNTTNKNWSGIPLPVAVKQLPTPTAQAAKHGSTPDLTADGYGHNLWDLPHLVTSIGENTEKQLTDGHESLDE